MAEPRLTDDRERAEWLQIHCAVIAALGETLKVHPEYAVSQEADRHYAEFVRRYK